MAMSSGFLLDTNIVIGFLKGNPDIVGFLNKSEGAGLYASVITRMELLSFHGITRVEENLIHDFLNALTLVLLDADVEATAIRLRKALRCKMPDAIVAASAITSDATLLTCDQALAELKFPGLTTCNPASPS
jgi:predicted nucleic acid-binding protein